MTSTRTRKRRRPVTSCHECYRRKQKCSRVQPCNICVARGIPEKCFFGEPLEAEATTSQLDSKSDTPKRVRLTSENESADHQSAQAEDLANQAGYSTISGSNTWTSLHGILGNPVQTSNLSSLIQEEIAEAVSKLPPRKIQSKLKDVFLTHSLWWFSSLQPYYVNRLYLRWLALSDGKTMDADNCHSPKDVLYFPALLFQMLAVALQYLPYEETEILEALDIQQLPALDRLSFRYSRLGMQIMDCLGRHNSCITAVQHDILRAIWLKNTSRGSEAWYSNNNAIRQAQELGLHLQAEVYQPPGEDIRITLRRLWYDEYKRRIWVCLLAGDAHMSLILGRPRAINASDSTIRTPIDCDIPEDPSQVIPSAIDESAQPSSFAPQLFQYKTGLLIHEMMSLGADKPTVDYTIIQNLHDKFVSLMNDSSPFVRPIDPDTSWDERRSLLTKQRPHLRSAAFSYLMNLHRPHITDHHESRDHAIQAGLNVLDAQQRIYEFSAKHMLRLFAYSFYTIDASIFLSGVMIDHHQMLSQDIKQEIGIALQTAIARLGVIKENNPMARSGEQILLRCYEKISPIAFDDTSPSVLTVPTLTYSESIPPNHMNGTHGSTTDGSMKTPQYDWQSSEFGFTAFQNWMDTMDQIIDPNFDIPIADSIWNSLAPS